MDFTWPKTIQITPNTTKTVARYKDETEKNGYFEKIIFFWALLETKDGMTYVVGYNGVDYPDNCSDSSNFIGYFQTEDKYYPNVHIPMGQTPEKPSDHET